MYNIVHVESGKSIIIKQNIFNRDKILEQASTIMNTALDIKKHGEYQIIPTFPR